MGEEYRKALRRGERDARRAVAEGRHPHLPALEELVPNVRTLQQERLGVMQVPLHMVAGTLTTARQNAFSCTFMPLLGVRTEFATKWSRLYQAQMDEGFRDPVRVYEYLHRFYVTEGNKRTSVLRYLGAPSVEAEVIRIIPAAERDEGSGNDASPDGDLALYREFLRFWRVCPLYCVDLSFPESYGRLAALLGHDLQTPWPEDDVRRLRSSYLFFESTYLAAGGDHLDITAGDALLVYLGVYGADGLLETPVAVLRGRIGKLWAELATSGPRSLPVIVSEPEGAHPGALASLVRRLPYTRQRPYVAAFAYDAPTATSRWAHAHDEGRRTLEGHFGGIVSTLAYEDCSTEDRLRAAIDDAQARGAQVFFSCAPSLMEATVRAAAEHPGMRFLNCSVNLPHGLVRSYYGRMYEVKFVAGAMAASLASNHVVGYRASLPVLGSIAEVNAFAEGVALVDPHARVVLDWGPRGGNSGTDALVGRGITTISGSDIEVPFDDPLAHGLYQVVDGRVRNLAVPFWDWGRYYRLIVSSLLQGELPGVPRQDERDGAGAPRAVTYWYGMSSGVVDLVLSDDLPSGTRKLANLLRRAVMSGEASPFEGELVAQDGTVVHRGTGRLGSRDVVSMRWLAQNVEGELPPEALEPAAQLGGTRA